MVTSLKGDNPVDHDVIIHANTISLHDSKYVLYGELVTETHTVDRPYLRYKDTRKRDMKMRLSPVIVETGEQLSKLA